MFLLFGLSKEYLEDYESEAFKESDKSLMKKKLKKYIKLKFDK